MSQVFALRTDKEFILVKAFVDSKGFGGYAVRELSGSNEHWHWLLEVPSALKITQFRTQLTRAVPTLKGNASYSAVVCTDVDKYERYMAKGDSEGQGCEVAWSNSIKYSAEKIDELHATYWLENRKLKKRKAGSMIDWLIDEAKRLEIRWSDRDRLALLMVKELGRRGKPVNLYSIKSNLNSVQLALCPDDSMADTLVGYLTQY